ncbi:MAG: Crp/Fnr family transcriptional regulator [Marinifilaceae bacterium]|jgi:CRP-like cAMP-binding protein|nr:Crp/Fnr family transcriptional regulator [Marinifilaceae bacterium]
MNIDVLASELVESPVFRGLSKSEIIAVLEKYPYKIKSYKKSDFIAFREDKCNSLIIILEGNVKGEMMDPSGKLIKIEDIYAPFPIASAFIFGKNKFPVDVIANTDVKTFSITKEVLVEIFQENKVLLVNYLNQISNRSQFLAQKLMFLTFNNLKTKIANYILQQPVSETNIVELNKTQEEMAQLFGVTRPSFARSLKELESDGAIKLKRKKIEIINRAKLISLKG